MCLTSATHVPDVEESRKTGDLLRNYSSFESLHGTSARTCVICVSCSVSGQYVYVVGVLKTFTARDLPPLCFQERALEVTRERLRSELGEMALKRSTLINGNFREMPSELEPTSVQLVV